MDSLSDEELTQLLDIVAAQPLNKVYNLFQKLLAEMTRRKRATEPVNPAP